MQRVSDLPGLDLPALGERQSLRQSIAESLRAQIMTGRMEPGAIYSAPRLAAMFGVSPTPVREAMLDLVAEGHVEAVKNKGFRIVALSAQELDELVEIRGFIEPPVMAMVARRAPDSPDLRRAIEALRPRARAIVETAARSDFVRYIEEDTRFHLGFLALHGNAHLVDEIQMLRQRSRLLGLDALHQESLVELATEHEEMVDLALEGDDQGLLELTQRHIAHVRQEWAGADPH